MQECSDEKQDWFKSEHSFYLLLNISFPNWSDAGADLPFVRSADENTSMLDMILNKPTVPEFGIWLGLYREDDDFHWIDGTLLAGQFSARAKEEPNNFRDQEKCVHMPNIVKRRVKWNDVSCQMKRNVKPAVLCQKYL